MRDRQIWTVEGTTGEYSDRREWTVMAYLNKALAEKHCADAIAEAVRLGASRTRQRAEVTYDQYVEDAEKNKFDPDMSCDYSGVDYYVHGPITLRDTTTSFAVKTPSGFLTLLPHENKQSDPPYRIDAPETDATRFATAADAKVWVDGESDEIVEV